MKLSMGEWPLGVIPAGGFLETASNQGAGRFVNSAVRGSFQPLAERWTVALWIAVLVKSSVFWWGLSKDIIITGDKKPT